MANLLYQQIEMLSREKHIEPEVVVSAIEDAMVVAARKYYKTEEDLRAKFNQETGQVDVFSVYTVVKEVILQKVREAERDTIYNEYHTRVGELVTVIVKRAEGPDLIVDMGRTEA